MLTKRIIPCLDVKEGRVVKGVSFLNLRDAGDPVELAKRYDEEGADELVFLDISASFEGRETMIEVVKQTAGTISIPFTVGGGINSVEAMTKLLRAGADKVSINTSALLKPDLINQGARRFGNQCIVVAIDAKFNSDTQTYEVYSHGGKNPTGQDVIAWAKEAEKRGAGEILLTSMDQDGQKNGFDLELNRQVSRAVTIPVIASGGAGTIEHFYEGVTVGKADAVLAASVFHYQELTINEVKTYMSEKGVPVR